MELNLYFLIHLHDVPHSQSFVGGQLCCAFVVLLNIKRSLCILTDCVSLSHSSAMKSYHFDPQCVTEIWCLSNILCVFIVSLYYITDWTAEAAVGLFCICVILCWKPVGLFCICVILRWKPGPETGCPVIFHGFPQLLKNTLQISPHYCHLLFTDHFIIQYCILVLLLTALLNK